MKKCSSCGKEVDQDIKVCNHCGADLESPETVEEESAPEIPVSTEASEEIEMPENEKPANNRPVKQKQQKGRKPVEPKTPKQKKQILNISIAIAIILIGVITFTIVNVSERKSNAPVTSTEKSEKENKGDKKDKSSNKDNNQDKPAASGNGEASAPAENKGGEGNAQVNNTSSNAPVSTEHIEESNDIKNINELEALIDELNDPDISPERKEELLEIVGGFLGNIEGETVELPQN